MSNSLREQIQQNKVEFQNWFLDSKVVDECGEPRLVFHGTCKDFEQFNIAQQRMEGFYFTSCENVAREVYAWDACSRVLSAYLSIQNPLGYEEYFELAGLNQAEETSYGRDAPVNYFDNNWEQILSFARAHGFDGLMWPADPDSKLPHDLIVVFSPEQIKIANPNVQQRQRGPKP